MRRMIEERLAELRWALKEMEPLVQLASLSTNNSVLRPTRSIKEHQVEALFPTRIIDG